jgi:hypothetical protein
MSAAAKKPKKPTKHGFAKPVCEVLEETESLIRGCIAKGGKFSDPKLPFPLLEELTGLHFTVSDTLEKLREDVRKARKKITVLSSHLEKTGGHMEEAYLKELIDVCHFALNFSDDEEAADDEGEGDE